MSDKPAYSEAAPPGVLAQWWGVFLLLGITVLAVAVRVYRLGEESLWYDEVITVAFLDEPGLAEFFEAWRFTNWNAVPIYYVIEYAWGNLFNGSVIALRLLSIAFGVMAVPLLYVFGRDLFNRSAGLIAALCLSLSAVHIFQAQEIRNYSLTMLTALICAYTFYRYIARPTAGTFVMNAMGNLLLVWTHLFGCYLLVALGCFLLLFRWRHWRVTVPWFIINLVLMIPSVFWVFRFEPIQYYQPPPPDLWMVVNNWLTDVWSPVLNLGIPAGFAWQIERTEWMRFLAESYHLVDNLTLALFAGAVLGLGAYALWRGRGKQDAAEERGLTLIERYAFLCFWLLLPGTILFVMAWTWRTDVVSPKYTVYSSMAGYLLLGGAITQLPHRALRWLAVALVLALFGHRYLTVAAHPQRPDWNSARTHIRASHEPNEVALVYPEWMKLVAEYHVRDTGIRVLPGEDLRMLCNESSRLAAEGKSVTSIFAIGFGHVPVVARYVEFLDRRGITYERSAFWGGMKCIFLVRLPRQEDFERLPQGAREAMITDISEGWNPGNDGAGAAIPIEE